MRKEGSAPLLNAPLSKGEYPAERGGAPLADALPFGYWRLPFVKGDRRGIFASPFAPLAIALPFLAEQLPSFVRRDRRENYAPSAPLASALPFEYISFLP